MKRVEWYFEKEYTRYVYVLYNSIIFILLVVLQNAHKQLVIDLQNSSSIINTSTTTSVSRTTHTSVSLALDLVSTYQTNTQSLQQNAIEKQVREHK